MCARRWGAVAVAGSAGNALPSRTLTFSNGSRSISTRAAGKNRRGKERGGTAGRLDRHAQGRCSDRAHGWLASYLFNLVNRRQGMTAHWIEAVAQSE